MSRRIGSFSLLAALPLIAQADPATDYAENCAACHGDGGTGGLLAGAPSLTDHSVLYGQDEAAILSTLRHGRRGIMPAWSQRLSPAEINLLAFYVSALPEAKP